MGMDIGSAQELLHQIWEPNETWTGLMHVLPYNFKVVWQLKIYNNL
jgi:hypothetical protein